MRQYCNREEVRQYGGPGRYYSIYGHDKHCYYYDHGLYRVRAKDEQGSLYDIIVYTADLNNRWPILCAIDFGNCEEVEMFDNNGNSRSGKYTLTIESRRFELGDYVKTDTGTIGIYEFSIDQLMCSIDRDGRERVERYSFGTPVELCNEEERKTIDEMLWVHDLVFNAETKNLEKIQKD